MSLFFETIFIKDKKIRNLKYHNIRLNKTISENFGINCSIDLKDHIIISSNKAHRVKVIYEKEIKKVEIYPILKREFKSFKLIESNIEYRYKYLERKDIDTLYKKREKCDDIFIINNGFLRDSSIANIAIFKDGEWLTPKSPLLYGTMRANLLDRKIIKESDIKIQHLKSVKKIALLNAIIGFCKIEDFKIRE